MQLIDILQRGLDLDAVAHALEVDHVRDRFLALVQVAQEGAKAVRLVEGVLPHGLRAEIRQADREIRVQVGRLVETGAHVLLTEARLLKDLRIREKIDDRPGPLRLTDGGEQAVLQFHHRHAPLIAVLKELPALLDLYGHSLRQRVHHGGADTVQAAAGLVGGVVELASGVQGREDDALRADTEFVHIDRDAAAVVLHRAGSVLLQPHVDRIAVSRQVFVNGIVHDLVDQVVQASRRGAADIHARPGAHRFQSFQDADAAGVI